MILSIIVIVLTVIVLLKMYKGDYVSGVGFGMLVLVAFPETIQVTITPTIPDITILRVVLVVMIVKCVQRTSMMHHVGKGPIWPLLLLIAGCYAISTIFSNFFVVGLKSYLSFLIETIACFWVVTRSLQSSQDAVRLLKYIGLGFTVVSILAIFERYLGLKIHELFPRGFNAARYFWASGKGQITSTYAHRILLGVACSLGALKHIIDLSQHSNSKDMSWSLIQAFACMAALYFSSSRGPWLSFLLGFILVVVILRGKALSWGVLFGIASVLLILIRPGVGTTIGKLYSSTLESGTVKFASYEWRYVILSTAIHAISRAAIIQSLFGFGGWSELLTDFGSYEIAPGIWLPIRSWDCEYAVILYERGIIGIALYLFMEIYALAAISRKIRDNTESSSRGVLICCLVSLVVLDFAKASVAIFAPQLVYFEACILGISSWYLSMPQERKRTIMESSLTPDFLKEVRS